MNSPLHPLISADQRRTADLSPTGLPCPEHSSTTIDGRCYWHLKSAHLRGEHVSLEARNWVGFDQSDPEPEWNTDRGWRSAEHALRTVAREDEEREAAMRGVRWLVDLGEATMELSV